MWAWHWVQPIIFCLASAFAFFSDRPGVSFLLSSFSRHRWLIRWSHGPVGQGAALVRLRSRVRMNPLLPCSAFTTVSNSKRLRKSRWDLSFCPRQLRATSRNKSLGVGVFFCSRLALQASYCNNRGRVGHHDYNGSPLQYIFPPWSSG